MTCDFGEFGKEAPPIYHGTTADRWQCIIQSGFKVSSGFDTPAAFGKGIYFTTLKSNARIYATAKARDDVRLGKKRHKACVLEKKFKNDASIMHVDYAPTLKVERAMEKDKPKWFEPLLNYIRFKYKDDPDLIKYYVEKWNHRYNHGLDESERYELADFARVSGCDAIRWYSSMSSQDKSLGNNYRTRDIILVLNQNALR